ncbi:MAG: F0F1 ATP synthase subunit B [Thermodesulfobacteriota bacterium]|nr:F0F1 ATP synthase subunit B [Thermodesulfobacteriota bacterium]
MEGFLGLTLPNFIGQMINFIILLTLLIFFGYKPIRRMLDERSDRIRQSMKQAEATKQEYENARIEVDKRISKARDEGQLIAGQAEKAGEKIKEEARQEARKEAQAIVEKTRAEIERERDNTINELRKEFVDIAILAAEKVISNTLDKEKHRLLIEKTLEESAALSKRN